MDEKNIEKTVFVEHQGPFKYTRMPFRLKNTPATFQCSTSVILSLATLQHAPVYIDNIIIFSSMREEHPRHIDEVLRLIMMDGVRIKLKRCHFYSKSIVYLGHAIAPGKTQVAQKITKIVEALRYQRNVSKTRFFLRLCNVHRKFEPTFARLATPFN